MPSHAPARPLAVRMSGPADGPPLVFLHSIGCDADMWRDQAIHFQDQRRVICIDLPGHGFSADIAAKPDMEDYARQVLGTLAGLKVDACDLVGLSLGGMVAAAAALLARDRVRRLVICDARLDAPADYRRMWDGLIALAESDGMDAVAAFMIKRWFGDGPRAANQRVARIEQTLRATPASGFLTAARAIQNLDLADRAGGIAIPTLLIVGSEDGVLPEVMEVLRQNIPGSALVTIPGAGHLSNIDQPDAFAAALREHLQD